MLLRKEILAGIVDGAINLVFRRWTKPTVKTGGRLRTRAGELAIEMVEQVNVDKITAKDAKRAGFADRDAHLIPAVVEIDSLLGIPHGAMM